MTFNAPKLRIMTWLTVQSLTSFLPRVPPAVIAKWCLANTTSKGKVAFIVSIIFFFVVFQLQSWFAKWIETWKRFKDFTQTSHRHLAVLCEGKFRVRKSVYFKIFIWSYQKDGQWLLELYFQDRILQKVIWIISTVRLEEQFSAINPYEVTSSRGK